MSTALSHSTTFNRPPWFFNVTHTFCHLNYDFPFKLRIHFIFRAIVDMSHQGFESYDQSYDPNQGYNPQQQQQQQQQQQAYGQEDYQQFTPQQPADYQQFQLGGFKRSVAFSIRFAL